jgi:predicted HTH transcriptional regulator
MSKPIQVEIEELARVFATGVLQKLQGASLQDILSATGQAPTLHTVRLPKAPLAPAAFPGKRIRRGPEEITAMAHRIVKVVKEHPEGILAEDLRKALGCDAKDIPLPVAEAMKNKWIKRVGEKRGTTYLPGKV